MAPLITALADSDAEVRQMAAFALGLLGVNSARDPLVGALADPAAIVQGSAAEALGLLGDPAAAAAIGRFASQLLQSTQFAQAPGEDDDVRRDTPTSACRLAIYALVRLNAYPQLASAVLDASGQPRVRVVAGRLRAAAPRESGIAAGAADAGQGSQSSTRARSRSRGWRRSRTARRSRC